MLSADKIGRNLFFRAQKRWKGAADPMWQDGGGLAVSEYQVALMGIPSVLKDGKIVHFPYRKAEAIFYYLCVEKETNRDELISVFWGGQR